MNAVHPDRRVGSLEASAWPAVTSASARWLRFNLVGVLGFVVQMAVLSLLTSWAGLGADVAVGLAVLAASLSGILCVGHNMRSVDAQKTEVVPV